jgi:hypothetical protein
MCFRILRITLRNVFCSLVLSSFHGLSQISWCDISQFHPDMRFWNTGRLVSASRKVRKYEMFDVLIRTVFPFILFTSSVCLPFISTANFIYRSSLAKETSQKYNYLLCLFQWKVEGGSPVAVSALLCEKGECVSTLIASTCLFLSLFAVAHKKEG